MKYRLYTHKWKNRQICDTIRLHVFTRLICLFDLGLPSLPFPSSLVRLAATRNDFLHNPRELQGAALPCWFEPAKRLLLQICAKKRRGRDARMMFCLVYFFAPFPYITFPILNYVIPQAMPHARFHKLIPIFTLTTKVWYGTCCSCSVAARNENTSTDRDLKIPVRPYH